ncbi:MAG: radical SAM protein [Gemmatimonadota bacterium]|nr:radical SAM protein [Gemmatimonadota bacterium]MDH5804478.1 radical SAM protein [Gemmatimonadota bacterium]
MTGTKLPVAEQSEKLQISPEYVRISMAAALVLGLKTGRFFRDGATRCVNLLQNYPEGCWANCTYCGLARERPGEAEDNTFIRVDWPLYSTEEVAQSIAAREEAVGRVCIAQVHDKRANEDLVTMTEVVRRHSKVPISALVSANLLDQDWLTRIKNAGVDVIGIGLDAASEDVFYETRGRGTKGPHTWEYHWDIVNKAREMYGPHKVNCHVVVGLGETDEELVNLFQSLREIEVEAYLFSFNPEPGTAMEQVERAPIHRWRRVQLVKSLLDSQIIQPSAISFDSSGNIENLAMPKPVLEDVVRSGTPFMTDGCPDEEGELACNRPYGSYRPGEEFRDYPFLPILDDTVKIRHELRLDELVR